MFKKVAKYFMAHHLFIPSITVFCQRGVVHKHVFLAALATMVLFMKINRRLYKLTLWTVTTHFKKVTTWSEQLVTLTVGRK